MCWRRRGGRVKLELPEVRQCIFFLPFPHTKSKDEVIHPLYSSCYSDHFLHWVWLLLGIPLFHELITDGADGDSFRIVD